MALPADSEPRCIQVHACSELRASCVKCSGECADGTSVLIAVSDCCCGSRKGALVTLSARDGERQIIAALSACNLRHQRSGSTTTAQYGTYLIRHPLTSHSRRTCPASRVSPPDDMPFCRYIFISVRTGSTGNPAGVDVHGG
jgi:hypothetical protein